MNKDTESPYFATIPYLVHDVIFFQLIKGIFTKTIIGSCFREANDTKSEVQCTVNISKVFKVLFRISNIDMENKNCILKEVFETLFHFGGRVIFSVKRKNILKEINIRVYLIMNRIIFY